MHALQQDIADGHSHALVGVRRAGQHRAAQGLEDIQGLEVHHGGVLASVHECMLVHVPALPALVQQSLESLPLLQRNLPLHPQNPLPLLRRLQSLLRNPPLLLRQAATSSRQS